MATNLIIPPGVEIPLVTMRGPGGDIARVNFYDVEDWKTRGWVGIDGGEKIVVKDTGTPDPEVAYSTAGNEAFANAKAEGKSDEEAGEIARKAAQEAKLAAWNAKKATVEGELVGWLQGEHAKLAKEADARKPWQVAGDEAFKAALDGGKSIKQATNAAYKAAEKVDGCPLK